MRETYSKYSLSELNEALSTIDREAHPERVDEIRYWINIRKSDPQENPNEFIANSSPQKYKCSKCDFHHYELGEFHAAGSTLAKLFDIQSQKFTTVSCTRCFHTEVYKCTKDRISDVFDFLIG